MKLIHQRRVSAKHLVPRPQPLKKSGLKEALSVTASIVFDVNKAAYPVLVVVGMALLSLYINAEGAVMPPPSSGLIIFLVLFAGCALLLALIFSAAILMPFYIKASIGINAKRALRPLFESEWRPSWAFFEMYILLYGPFIALILSMIFSLPDTFKYFSSYAAVFVGVSALFFAVWLYLVGLPWGVCWYWVILNAVSAQWVFAILLIFLKVAPDYAGDVSDNVARIIIFIAILANLILHVLMNLRDIKTSDIMLGLFFLIFTLMLFPGPYVMGGTALRFLGYGGRISAHIEWRNGQGQKIEEDNACIILMMGEHVQFLSYKDAESAWKACHLVPNKKDQIDKPVRLQVHIRELKGAVIYPN